MNVAVVLAAGEGTRMKSKKHKVLMKVCGVSMINHVLKATESVFSKRVVVVGNKASDVMMEVAEQDVIFKKQPIGEGFPYGTGFAVMQSTDVIDDGDSVMVLCADTPLLSRDTVKGFMDFFTTGDYDGAVLTTKLDNPYGYGRIIRDETGAVKRIVEEKDASADERSVKEVNSGIFAFKGKYLKESLKNLSFDNASGELYLTDSLKIMVDCGLRFGAYIVDDSIETAGVNDRSALADCERIMRERIICNHMKNGVSFIDPKSTYVDVNSEIGADCVIYPNTFIVNSKIGEDVIVYESNRIENSKIGNGCVIRQSFIENSVVGERVTIGPFAHLRPNCVIEDDAHIGNFVEFKNSNFGRGSKAGHLAYIGDADVGSGVNIGCGVVFVNYDGKQKHRSVVKDGAFIGSNANLVAPVTVEESGFVAAGSTITKNVKSNALAIERAEQIVVDDWVLRRKNK